MIRLSLVAVLVAGWVFASAESGRGQQDKPKKPRPAVAELLKSTPQEFIRRYDKNKDGSLSREELPPRLANAFEKFDANDDGKLDAKEVGRMLEIMRRRFAADDGARPAKNPEAADRIVTKLLAAMDKNKDGKISRAEAEGRVADAFDLLDTNRDGSLDKAELRKLAARLLAQQGGNGPAAAGRRPAPDFDSLDQNADGRLTREELKGTPLHAAFDAMDADGNGKVTPKEFEAYLKKQAASDGPAAGKKR